MQSYIDCRVISKVETLSHHVKTHCKPQPLVLAAKNSYFCLEMRTFGRIAYWLVALALLAVILVSLDYSLGQAILISLIFCPCAMALEYFMPKARKPMDKVYLSISVMIAVILLILLLHHIVWARISPEGFLRQDKSVAPMLINPAFLGLILTALSIGDFYWSKWLGARFPDTGRTITFFSDRRSLTLPIADIAYLESNDTEVRVVTSSGTSYRNKTGIGQWENLLGPAFLRIHRSYLVNVSLATLSGPDTVLVGDLELPVSRKYKDSVQQALRDTCNRL